MRWLITFTNDGTLVDGGMMPALIQWHGGAHPERGMRDSRRLARAVRGCTSGPRIVSPRPRVDRRGPPRRDPRERAGERPHLIAHIRTPDGVRTIR